MTSSASSPVTSMLDQVLQMATNSCSMCGLDMGDVKRGIPQAASTTSEPKAQQFQGGIDDIKQVLLIKFREALKAKIIDGFPC